MIRYSPRPLSTYSRKIGQTKIGPADSAMISNTGIWNLAYLSYDFEKSLQHPDPNFTVLVRHTFRTRLDGSGVDIAGIQNPDELVGSLLALTAPRFTYIISRHTVLTTLPMYQAYGYAWLATIDARARVCQFDDEDSESTPPEQLDLSAARANLKKILTRV